MPKVTKAQDVLLRKLENGYEITFSQGHYCTTKDGTLDDAKLWPSTFYGLYDDAMIERMDNGNYTISIKGRKQING